MNFFKLLFITLLFFSTESSASSGYQLFEEGGKFGLLGEQGNIVIPASYDKIGWSGSEELVIDNLVGVKRNNHWSLYDLKKGELTSSRFISLSPFSENLFLASRRGKLSGVSFFGLIDEKGKVILGFQYSSVESLSEYFKVSKYSSGENLYGIVDRKENLKVPIRFRVLNTSEKDYWRGMLESSIYIFNNEGTKIFEVEADSIFKAGDGNFVYYRDGKAGILSSSGEVKVDPSFKNINWTQNGYTALPFPEWKAFDKNGSELFQLSFDNIVPVSEKLKLIEQNSNWGLINHLGEFIIEPHYESILQTQSEYFLALKDQKWSVINDFGDPVLTDFDSIRPSENFFLARKKALKANGWSIYNRGGEKVSQSSYSSILDISSGLFPVKQNNYWGFINSKGKMVVQIKYEYVKPFMGKNAIVKYHGKFGLIDQNGDFLIQPVADTLYRLNSELFGLKRGYLTEVVDSNGEVFYNSLGHFETHPCGILEIDEEDRYGFLNEFGKLVIEPEIDQYLYFEDANILYLRKEDAPSGLYSCDVFEYIRKDLNYEELYPFSEGFAAIKLDGSYGFIDHDKNLRIANRYDSVISFSDGYAGVKINGKWGFIDDQERLQIQPYYESVAAFTNGKSIVSIDGVYGIIDQRGEELIPVEFDEIELFLGIGYKVRKNNLYGFFSIDLANKVNTKYESLELLNDRWLKVRRKSNYGIVNFQGLNEFSFVYSEILQDSFENITYLKTSPEWRSIGFSAN